MVTPENQTILGKNFLPYSTRTLITFLWRMQIHQDKKHFVPQEKPFQAINVILHLKPAIIYSMSLKVLQMFVEKCYFLP